MKNIWKINKKKIYIFIYLSIFLICCILNVNNAKQQSKNNNEIKRDLNNESLNQNANIDIKNYQYKGNIYNHAKVYVENNKEIISKCFSDRVSIIKGQDILIGTNKKELDNGYYDICISLKDGRLVIGIVKLWKNIDSKALYDKNYIRELARCILSICKDRYTDNEIFKMEEYILKLYFESKKENPNIENIEIDNVRILSEVKEGVLLMSIY